MTGNRVNRDAFPESLGLTVIPIPVKDVMQNLKGGMEMFYHHPALSDEVFGPPRPTGTPPEEGN